MCAGVKPFRVLPALAGVCCASLGLAQSAVQLSPSSSWLASEALGHAPRVAPAGSFSTVNGSASDVTVTAGSVVASAPFVTDNASAPEYPRYTWMDLDDVAALAFSANNSSDGVIFGGSKLVLAGATFANTAVDDLAISGLGDGGAGHDFLRAGTSASINAGATGSLQTAFLWQKADFTNGYEETGTNVTISRDDALSFSGYTEGAKIGGATGHWLVQTGGTYYVSTESFVLWGAEQAFSSSALLSTTWASVSFSNTSTTSDPLVTLGTPNALPLTSLTAVGVLLDADIVGGEAASVAQIRMTGFGFTPQAVPEPATWAALCGAFALGLAIWRQRGPRR